MPSKHVKFLIKSFWIHVHVHVHVGRCLLLCMHVVIVQISCGQLSRDKISTCVYLSRVVGLAVDCYKACTSINRTEVEIKHFSVLS